MGGGSWRSSPPPAPSLPPSHPNTTAQLGDLGIARALSNNSDFAHTIVGTPFYLSPELCEDKPYNEKSDIWALGVVLVRMAAIQMSYSRCHTVAHLQQRKEKKKEKKNKAHRLPLPASAVPATDDAPRPSRLPPHPTPPRPPTTPTVRVLHGALPLRGAERGRPDPQDHAGHLFADQRAVHPAAAAHHRRVPHLRPQGAAGHQGADGPSGGEGQGASRLLCVCGRGGKAL